VATGGDDKVVRLWDPATGRQLRECTGHTQAVNSLAFSADGKLLATASKTASIRVWDPQTGKELRRFGQPMQQPRGSVLAFAPDGKTLAATGDTLTLWDATSGQLLSRAGRFTNGTAVAFSPDGKLLTTGEVTLCVHEAATGKLLPFDLQPPPRNPAWYVHGISFSPDSKLVASPRGILGAATGKEVCWFEPGSYHASAVAFSPDGRTVAVADLEHAIYCGPWMVRLWEVSSGQVRHTFPVPSGKVHAVAFTPDGKAVVTAHADGTALVWDVFGREDTRPRANLTPSRLEAFWGDLAGTPTRAYRGLGELLRDPEPATAFLRGKVQALPDPEPAHLRHLVADLGDKRFAVRERAHAELAKLREFAEPALREGLRVKLPLEAQRRVEGLLNRLDQEPAGSERLRLVRAIEVLEHIGNQEARQLLAMLAQPSRPVRLAAEARAALGRLSTRSSATPPKM
jgi:hypothetical protein